MAKQNAKENETEEAPTEAAQAENPLLTAISQRLAAGGMSEKTVAAMRPAVENALNAVECLRVLDNIFADYGESLTRAGKIYTEARNIREDWERATGLQVHASPSTAALVAEITARAGGKIDVPALLNLTKKIGEQGCPVVRHNL